MPTDAKKLEEILVSPEYQTWTADQKYERLLPYSDHLRQIKDPKEIVNQLRLWEADYPSKTVPATPGAPVKQPPAGGTFWENFTQGLDEAGQSIRRQGANIGDWLSRDIGPGYARRKQSEITAVDAAPKAPLIGGRGLGRVAGEAAEAAPYAALAYANPPLGGLAYAASSLAQNPIDPSKGFLAGGAIPTVEALLSLMGGRLARGASETGIKSLSNLKSLSRLNPKELIKSYLNWRPSRASGLDPLVTTSLNEADLATRAAALAARKGQPSYLESLFSPGSTTVAAQEALVPGTQAMTASALPGANLGVLSTATKAAAGAVKAPSVKSSPTTTIADLLGSLDIPLHKLQSMSPTERETIIAPLREILRSITGGIR